MCHAHQYVTLLLLFVARDEYTRSSSSSSTLPARNMWLQETLLSYDRRITKGSRYASLFMISTVVVGVTVCGGVGQGCCGWVV